MKNWGRFKVYQQSFGLLGPWLAMRAQLSSQPFDVTTIPPGTRYAVTLRLKTSDLTTFQKVFLDREYALTLARHPRTIIDAGANIGLASVFFANLYPDSRILAVEPEESNFNLLKQNVAPYPNVLPIHAALWKSSGEIDLVDPGLGPWGFRAADLASTAAVHLGKVRAVTVEGIMTEHELDYVDLLKVDIEGAEREVFADASAWIEKVGVLAVELHDRYQVGCSRNFYLATRSFDLELQNGENVFMLRREFIPVPR